MLNADKNDPAMSILMNSTIVLIDTIVGMSSVFVAYLHDILVAWLRGTEPCLDDVRCSRYHTWLQLKESLEFFTRFSKDVFYKTEKKKEVKWTGGMGNEQQIDKIRIRVRDEVQR